MHQKLHLTRTHYKYGCTRRCILQELIIKWMPIKLQNYKNASEYNSTLDAPEFSTKKKFKGVSK